MQKLFVYLFTIILVLGVSGITNATLIGDNVLLEMNYHNWGNVFGSADRTVIEGDADLWQYDNLLNVNMEASSIFIDFTFAQGATSAHAFPQDNFTGIVVKDLNDSSGWSLQGYSICTNLTDESPRGPEIDWNSRVIFGSDYIGFNWVGLHFNNITYFNAELDFETNPVPEPSTMLLFVSGAICLVVIRKRNIGQN